jgi:hypothetical protein
MASLRHVAAAGIRKPAVHASDVRHATAMSRRSFLMSVMMQQHGARARRGFLSNLAPPFIPSSLCERDLNEDFFTDKRAPQFQHKNTKKARKAPTQTRKKHTCNVNIACVLSEVEICTYM